jgi:long-chain acyl-CoA synthetase
MLLRDIVASGLASAPDRPAIVFRDEPTTYREMDGRIKALAAGLAELGIGPGDRIALLLPNCPPFVYGYFAASWIGAQVVPCNPLLKAPELAYIWNDAAIRLVITVPQLVPLAAAAGAAVNGLEFIVSAAPPGDSPGDGIQDGQTLVGLAELIGRGAQRLPAGGLQPASIDENECAVIIYTSGTTGHPKGAMLSHRNLTRNVEQISAAIFFDHNDTFLTVLPLFHAFAGTVCLNTPMMLGCTSVLLENFAPARLLESLERWRVTIFPAVPAMFNALLAYPAERDYDLSALRVIISGGAPLPSTTLEALEKRFEVPVLEGDGPTECSPATSVNPLNGVRKVGSVGPPIPGVEIAIFDDDDNSLAPNEIGEIVVRGDNVMLGYLNQPEATAEAMKSGWYHTGDIGKIDEDGYVFILDRKKDMVITAGLNVYPREVEEVLFQHTSVADVAVIGLPDSLRGEEVVAVVVIRSGIETTDREIVAFCRERLANYKVPRRVLFRETLPRGGTGKVVKRLLKKELEMEGLE